MKSRFSVLLILIASLSCILLQSRAQSLHEGSSQKQPSVSFDKSEYDFGKISDRGGVVRHTFTFTNNGNAPLVILRIETSCSCTKGVFTKRPVIPGATGEVTITYDPKGQQGVFYKAIQVYSNADVGRSIIIVRGTVVKAAERR